MDEPRRRYAKGNKQWKKNTTWSHLYVESKTVKFIEAESRMAVTRVGKGGEKEEMSVKGYEISVLRDE